MTSNYTSSNRPHTTPVKPWLKAVLTVCRLLFGAVFIFSGFVKAIDPLGSTYKIQDYLTAFGGFFEHFLPLAMPAAVALSTIELLIGLSLFFNIRARLGAWGGLLFMLVMTPLTLYIAIANPVSDCGCFGDAVKLSNTATFLKNIVLLAVVLVLFFNRKRMYPVFAPGMEWGVLLAFAVAGVGLSVHCYRHLPFIDFRPYKVGANIPEGMTVPEGAPQDEYAITFIYEKDGVQQEFTLDNYPKSDTTWTFVDQRSTLIKKGYEPPIHDFVIEDEEWNDITDDVLAYEGQTYLVVAYDLKLADEGAMAQVQRLYNRCVLSRDTRCYVLTASTDEDIEQLRQRTGVTYPFCKMDPITLKTIIRSNPGIVLIQGGTVQAKWAWRDFFND